MPITYEQDPLVSEPTGRPGYSYGTVNRPPTDFASQLREWVDILVRGRRFIAGATLAVLIPVVAYAMLAPDVYEATAKLYVETGSNGELSSVLPGGDASFGEDRAIDNELYILQNSEDLANQTAQALIERGGAGAGLTILESGSDEPPPVDVVADRVAGQYLRVAQDGGGVNGVRVTVQSRVPEEAALIANLYAQAYVDRTQSSSRSSVSASRTFLESQVDSVSAELADREEATRAYMDREGAVRLDEEAANIVSQLATLEAGRDQARVDAGMEAARIAELRGQIASLEANLSRRLGSGTDRELAQDETRLTELRRRLENIYLRDPSLRTADSVSGDVAELRRQIATLERQIQSASGRLVDESIAAGGVDAAGAGLPRLSGLRDRLTESEVALRGLRSQIDIFNGRIASYQAELDRVPAQSLDLARLVRERESKERLALGLDQRLQEARVAESAELGYAEVIRAADVPSSPVAPNRPRTILLGLMMGLGLGIALAIVRAQMDQAVRRPGQLRELGYPVVGVVPDVTKLIAEDHGGADAVEINGRNIDSHLVALLAPMSTAAESFRGLRTSVQFALPDEVIRTLLVTSGSPGEGKSTVASNLAVVMAQAGRRTLLIDADLRRPRLHRIFGLSRSPGLSEQLVGEASASRDGRVGVEVADDLDVLPAGALVPNPAEHLGSASLRNLKERLLATYDVIVIDAPPVMAATDAILLSTQADATVMVAAAGKTKTFELEYATEEISGVGGRVIGVVLNRFDVSNEYGYRYQYAYRYGRTYGYGHEETSE